MEIKSSECGDELIRLQDVFPPRVVGVPPNNAVHDLMLLPDGPFVSRLLGYLLPHVVLQRQPAGAATEADPHGLMLEFVEKTFVAS